MGTKKLGNDYMVWVESATAGTFNLIRGQQGCSISRSATPVDLETKDDAGYGASAFGNKKLSVSLTLIPSLPDANGYTRLETLANATPPAPFKVQLRKGGATGGTNDVVFECLVYGNLDSSDFGQNSGVGVTATFSAASAPTVDALA